MASRRSGGSSARYSCTVAALLCMVLSSQGTVFGGRNQTDERARLVAGIKELVLFIRRNVDDIAGPKRSLALFRPGNATSRQYHDLVFVIVLMMRRKAAGRNLKMAHVKM